MVAYSRAELIRGGFIKLSETCSIKIQFQKYFIHNIKRIASISIYNNFFHLVLRCPLPDDVTWLNFLSINFAGTIKCQWGLMANWQRGLIRGEGLFEGGGEFED